MKVHAKLPMAAPLESRGDQTFGLGAVLRQIRERRGLSQAAVAKAAQMGRTSITNIEAGNQPLSLENLHLIAEALGMEVAIDLRPKVTGDR